ncbi:EF-hand domain-containing protein [Azospirillum sp. sgz302134]
MASPRFISISVAVLLSAGPFACQTPSHAACETGTPAPAGTAARAEAPGAQPTAPVSQAFAALDRDHDGTLTANELTAGQDQVLRLFDTDGDGKVSLQEFISAPLGPVGNRPGAPQRIAQVRTARFQQLDRNGDGVLTTDEFARVTVATVMELRDINCDGHLSLGELAAPLPQAPR